MKLGIGLPSALTPAVNRGLLLDWARQADQAGFHCFGTVDHPGYDAWDPIVALSAAAAVTERVRLMTSVLQLPPRNELQVAQQIATLDRLSGGRVDFGVAIGDRPHDYAAMGAKMKARGRKIERQIRKMKKTWRQAKKGTLETPSVDGPAPIQKPSIPIWVGGNVEAAKQRAIKLGDGYIYSAAVPSPELRDEVAQLKERAAAEKKRKFQVASLRYVALGDQDELVQAAELTERYYGGLWASPEDIFLHGGPEEIATGVKAYEEAGLDLLILIPQVPDVRQVVGLGEGVLPSFRVPGA
jgi:alkanesulfonate monooxygenase SsuD/methylene tetrahydromethanopterin reductase-like flavin-dependent oxidoreductase (luciferase family)